jgi:CheY-like chemotaxis protein
MPTGTPINILLVEDDPAHAEIVRRNLTDFPVENRMVHLEDGQAALDYLFHQGIFTDQTAYPQPHMILLDLRLPRVDGLEVLSRIKQDPGLRHIPTVVLSTSNANADILKVYEQGAGSYLVKPVDFDKFKRLMESFKFYWLTWNRFRA